MSVGRRESGAFVAPAPVFGGGLAAVRGRHGVCETRGGTMRRPRRVHLHCNMQEQKRGTKSGGAGGGDEQEYWANVGSVIDSLREDYPRIPDEEPSLALYSAAVTLRSRTGMVCQGRPAYRGVLWLIRAQLRMLFTARSLSVLGLNFDRQAAQIYVRWRLSGAPRMAATACPAFIYDGLSIYTLDDSGYIKDHLLDNIVRIRRPLRPLFESVLAAAVSGGAAPAPVGVPTGAGVAIPSWCAGDDVGNAESVDEGREDDGSGAAHGDFAAPLLLAAGNATF